MPTPRTRLIAWLRDLHRLIIEGMQAWGTRLGTYLILGNAGALVILFNAVVSGTACDLNALTRASWLFAAGLGSAFLIAGLSQFLAMRTAAQIADMINTMSGIEMGEFDLERIEAKHGQQPEEAPLNVYIRGLHAKAPQQIGRLQALTNAGNILMLAYIVPMVLFGAGIAMPATSGPFLASCAGG